MMNLANIISSKPKDGILHAWLDNPDEVITTMDDNETRSYILSSECAMLIRMDEDNILIGFHNIEDSMLYGHREYPYSLLGEESYEYLCNNEHIRLPTLHCVFSIHTDSLLDYLKTIYDYNQNIFLVGQKE